MTYREMIIGKKKRWVGRKVAYEGQIFTVVDVDYNGGLLINKPHYYCESYTAPTTSVPEGTIREAAGMF